MVTPPLLSVVNPTRNRSRLEMRLYHLCRVVVLPEVLTLHSPPSQTLCWRDHIEFYGTRGWNDALLAACLRTLVHLVAS
jgi:hypothetical protein